MTTETKPEKRTEMFAFYVTSQDKEYINELAAALEFKSPSRLVAAILERLIIGGFSPMVFLKLGIQFSKLSGKIPAQGFYFGVRPLPPLIDDTDPTEEEVIAAMEQYIKQHKKGKKQ